jgi:hypothetical protein
MFLRSLFIFSLMVISTGTFAASSEPTCPQPVLQTDGGFGNIEYKYIFAKVVPGPKTSTAQDLAQIIHQITIIANNGLTQGSQGCSVEAHVDQIAATSASGTINMRIRVDGSCSDYNNFAKTEDAELQLMRSVIEQIVKVPGLEVDPRWSQHLPCLRGGATGSN